MKVCFFLPSLDGGGAERVTLNLAKGFANKDIDVDIVLATAKGEYLEQVPETIRVVDLKSSRVISSLLGLMKYLKTQKPDFLVSGISHANIVAIYAKRVTNVKTKVIVTEHTTVSQTLTGSKGKIMVLLRKLFYPSADGIVAVSKGVADDLTKVIKLKNKKVEVIYNPVIDDILTQKSREVIEDSWLNSSQIPVILSVGRLSEAKDYETLIKSFAIIRKEINARLIILGEGELRHKLESLIHELELENDVKMPGFVENPYKYMANADIFVLSSKREGLPTVLIEALACGSKVLSTNCPSGPFEILDAGKYGILVDVGDVDKMAQSVIKILRLEIGHFDEEKLAEHLEQFKYTSVVNRYLNLLQEN